MLLSLRILVPLISHRCLELLISYGVLKLLLCLAAYRLVHSTVLEGNVFDITKELRIGGHVWHSRVHISSEQEQVIHLGGEAWIECVDCILELKKRTVLLAPLRKPLESELQSVGWVLNDMGVNFKQQLIMQLF